MKNVITVFLAFCSVYGYSQNLVPNPSFDEYLECPFSTAELQNQVVDWYSWSESPDYFHTCSDEIDGFVGIPENVLGYQNAITGNGYAGLYTHAHHGENLREYIAVELNEPLEIGVTYYLSFYASLYDGGVESDSWCATNHIGLRFFIDAIYNNQNNALQPDNFAHLDYAEILSDDTNWTLISGYFTADQEYTWLAIGNFFTDDQTQTLILNSEDRCFGIYYIENVCVAISPEHCDYLIGMSSIMANHSIDIYPNPATSDYIFIHSEVNSIQTIRIYDVNGRLMGQNNPDQSGIVQVEIKYLSKGIYFMKIQSNNEFSTYKFIKL